MLTCAPAGQYRWTVIPGNVAAGTFIEVEPGRRIVFGWGWEGSPDLGPDVSTVTITLEPVEGGTLVSHVQQGLTDEQVASHLQRWNHFFARLERAASTGDAGPDEWAAAPAELSPLTSAEAALAVCQNVLREIREGNLDRLTSCSEFTIGQLADHLIGSMVSLGRLAGRLLSQLAPGPWSRGWHSRPSRHWSLGTGVGSSGSFLAI